MKFKAWHLFLMGVIAQVILLVLLLYELPRVELQPGGQEWALGFMVFYLIGTIGLSSIILFLTKTRTPQTGSIVIGLGIGALIIVFSQQIPGVLNTIGLIGGIAVGALFITAGIMAIRKKI